MSLKNIMLNLEGLEKTTRKGDNAALFNVRKKNKLFLRVVKF